MSDTTDQCRLINLPENILFQITSIIEVSKQMHLPQYVLF